MKTILAACLIVASALPAQAISRYQAKGLSCEGIQDIIRQEGAVILRYPSPRNSSLTLYDRYVRNGNYCDRSEMIESTTVPSADRARCRVKHCVPSDDCDDNTSLRCRPFKRMMD